MALTSARQILNKKILGGGDVQELELEVAALSASVLTIGEKVENATEFSTTEKVVGKWVDGSDLYEKTWTTTAPSDVNTSESIVDLSNYNIDKMIKQDAFIVATDGTNITEHGGGSFVIWYRTALSPTTPKDCIMCNVSNVSYLSGTIYVTLQYTKTAAESKKKTTKKK